MPNFMDDELVLGENLYIVDTKDPHINSADFARLLGQDNVLNTELSENVWPAGFVPQHESIALDIACGPGGQVREWHRLCPHMRLIGIDNNRKAIAYARSHEATSHSSNVSFELMDILQPLDFLDASFDVVNARLLIGVLPQGHWPTFLSECKRILKPGGFIRLIECEMNYIVNAPITHQVVDLFLDFLWTSGRSFSRQQMSITPMLPSYLRDAAFSDVKLQMHGIDWSTGSRWHNDMSMDVLMSFQVMRPAFAKMMSGDEIDQLLAGMKEELKNVKAVWPITIATGRK